MDKSLEEIQKEMEVAEEIRQQQLARLALVGFSPAELDGVKMERDYNRRD